MDPSGPRASRTRAAALSLLDLCWLSARIEYQNEGMCRGEGNGIRRVGALQCSQSYQV